MQASVATGISRAALSKIERGEMSPTFDSLCKLASGLGIDIATLVSGRPPTVGGIAVTRAGEGARQVTERFVHRLIAPEIEKRTMYVFETDVVADSLDLYKDWDRHESEDMLYVLSGQVAVHLEGRDTILLGPGDSLQMDGRIPHALVAVPSEAEEETKPKAKILWVSVPLPTAAPGELGRPLAGPDTPRA